PSTFEVEVLEHRLFGIAPEAVRRPAHHPLELPCCRVREEPLVLGPVSPRPSDLLQVLPRWGVAHLQAVRGEPSQLLFVILPVERHAGVERRPHSGYPPCIGRPEESTSLYQLMFCTPRAVSAASTSAIVRS